MIVFISIILIIAASFFMAFCLMALDFVLAQLRKGKDSDVFWTRRRVTIGAAVLVIQSGYLILMHHASM